MRKRISRPLESPSFPQDMEFVISADGKNGSVLPAVKADLPPVSTFDVDNLLRNGVQLNNVSTFITSSPEQNMDTIDAIDTLINDNELNEF